MTFTSPIFLFGLLPWLLLVIWLTKRNVLARQLILIAANSIFYIWGGVGNFLFICGYVLSICFFSELLYRFHNKKLFILSIVSSVLPLIMMKYTAFAIENINSMMEWNLVPPKWIVPTGISFFTFEAVSLLVDIYSGRIYSRSSLLTTFLYLTFFPTIVSGPILRFQSFQSDIMKCPNTLNIGMAGEQIVLGLGKKVLIADKLAPLVNYYFDGIVTGNSFSTTGLWLGSIAFSLQLYFDFSGYSDMAIGIGRLLGFEMCKNFQDPYCASSISEFWRRWHISLSQWFRDYVYIPLGGNRCTRSKHVFNLLVVWLLTGIWHGADWSFVVWGIGYFLLLCAEKYIPFVSRIGKKKLGHLYTLFFVNILWVFFRADDLSAAIKYLSGMFDSTGVLLPEAKAIRFIPYLLLALLCCIPWKRMTSSVQQSRTVRVFRGLSIIFIGFLAVCAVINTTYMPYIYGSF